MRLLLLIMGTMVAAPAWTSDALKQLEEAEVRWRANAPKEYAFSFRYSALFRYKDCPDGFRSKVRGGLVDSISACESLRDRFATVPALFSYIRSVIFESPDVVKVDFDPRLGFPTRFAVDYRRDTTDDTFDFTVVDFVAGN